MPFTLLGNNALVTDPTKIRQDITSLALHSAVADNKSAYNLPNMFIDQFEDDTGIATETNTDRNSSEYVSPAVLASSSIGGTSTNIKLGTNTSASEFDVGTGGWTSSYTDDSVRLDTGSYTQVYVDQLFDMKYEFKIFLYMLDSAGNQTHIQYPAYTMFFSNNTTQSPVAEWSGFRDRTDSNNDYGYQPAYDRIFSDSASETIMGVGGSSTGFAGAVQNNTVTVTGNHRVGCYHNSNQGSGSKGLFLHNKRSSNELVVGFCDSNTLSEGNLKSYGKTTVNTSGLTDGLFAIVVGTANSNSNHYYSLTYNGGGTGTSERSYGTIDQLTVNATGTVIGTTQTASSSTTKVSGVMLYKDNSGTATLGTDLKIYFSCDNGSNWTEVSSYGTVSPEFSTGVKMIRLGETTCTAGTQIKYKAVWANQSSGSKDTQLHGIGMNF